MAEGIDLNGLKDRAAAFSFGTYQLFDTRCMQVASSNTAARAGEEEKQKGHQMFQGLVPRKIIRILIGRYTEFVRRHRVIFRYSSASSELG